MKVHRDEVQVIVTDLPCRCAGFTIYDGILNYTIYINARHNYEKQQYTLRHELSHIIRGDLDSYKTASDIEIETHN